MRRRSPTLSLLALQLLWAGIAWGQSSYKIQSVPLPTAPDVSTLQSVLQPEGERLLNPKGATVAEIWFAKSVPAQSATSSSGDVLYGGLSVGEFIALLHFPNGGSDFRGQTIKPGYYAMRYGLMPQDGNHMGVNPTRDFVLLVPVALDGDPTKPIGFNDLLKLSRQVSGTNHPAVINLAAASGQNFPSVAQDDQGHWFVQVRLPTTSGSLPFAVVLVGQAQS
jgi:hypothetical protein